VLFFLMQTLLLGPAMIWSRRARVRT